MSSSVKSNAPQFGKNLKAPAVSNDGAESTSGCGLRQFHDTGMIAGDMRFSTRCSSYMAFMWPLFLLAALAIEATVAWGEGGGHVLPPNARPHGYSLTRMVSLDALFQTSGNAGGTNSPYYPHTPFQILFLDPSQNPPPTQFTVYAGTMFYVPMVTVDDSPPIVGNFPVNASGAENYFQSPDQLGARGWRITVDDDTTAIGAAYFAGPVVQQNPPLLDGVEHIFLYLVCF